MALDERFDPENNERLATMLSTAKFELTSPRPLNIAGEERGAYFGSGKRLFLILNPQTGTSVHDHPEHRGGVLKYFGPIVESSEDFTNSLAYKYQNDSREKRIPDENDRVIKLSPGEDLSLTFGSDKQGRIIGRFYGLHNLSKVPVAAMLTLYS